MAGALDRLLGRAKGAAKDALASLLDHCLPPPDGGGAPASDGFAHPGTLMGPREARLLRSRVSAGAAPWAAAAAALAADTPLAYAPCALRRVHIDFNGVGAGHDEFVERDGRMAYMQAAMFAAAGDERYARNAAAILAAWAAANESFTGQNAPLVRPLSLLFCVFWCVVCALVCSLCSCALCFGAPASKTTATHSFTYTHTLT